jgi:hypothetical protein
MDAGWALILAAFVSAVGTVLVALIQKFRKENQADHNVVVGMLKILYKSHTRIEQKLDDHIQNHGEPK